jgi:hypothetical protein
MALLLELDFALDCSHSELLAASHGVTATNRATMVLAVLAFAHSGERAGLAEHLPGVLRVASGSSGMSGAIQLAERGCGGAAA